MQDLVELFCEVDDFCKEYLPKLKGYQIGHGSRGPQSRLNTSEVMTLVIYFHQMRFRDFKTYYIHYAHQHLKEAFPRLVSYSRFVELLPSILLPMCAFSGRKPHQATGIYFIDSTALSVCKISRASSNKVFQGLALKSKSTTGWYYGFKVHVLINHIGDILAFKLNYATTDDRSTVEALCEGLQGKLIADKGYLSQKLFKSLFQKGLTLITKVRKNMKNKFLPLIDACLLRKRGIIESVIGQLKSFYSLEHSRHRSPINFCVNLCSAFAAYALQPSKPSILPSIPLLS